MTVICEAVDAERHLERWGNLIVGCVDNHLARRELAKVSAAIWIDSGNHASAGQVVIGNTGDRDLVLRQLNGRNAKVAYLPHAGLLFPALLEPDADAEPTPQPQISCAELIAARSQELLVNDWMAVATAQYIYKLLHRQPITSFVTFVSSDGMSVRSVAIGREEVMGYLITSANSNVTVEKPDFPT
jgi:hypothetical protein